MGAGKRHDQAAPAHHGADGADIEHRAPWQLAESAVTLDNRQKYTPMHVSISSVRRPSGSCGGVLDATVCVMASTTRSQSEPNSKVFYLRAPLVRAERMKIFQPIHDFRNIGCELGFPTPPRHCWSPSTTVTGHLVPAPPRKNTTNCPKSLWTTVFGGD